MPDDPRPSVLHVAQPLDAGVPRVAAALVADQAERGWNVAVACPPDSDLRIAADRAGARWLEWRASRNPGPSVPREVRGLALAVDAAGPDLVHLHSAKAGLAGRLAIHGRRPTVFQPHAWSFEAVTGPVRAASVAWERLGARWADALVCVSDDERARGEDAGVRGRFAVIPNGVDLTAWAPASDDERAAARERLGIGSGPLAVAIGRLAEQKGQDVLLEAWPAVRARVPDAQLAVVGEGPLRASLETAARDGVHLAGKREDVAPWLAAARVVVIPSRWEAGLSLVAMEAMARGRSVVASDVAGTRDGLGGGGAVVPIGAAAPLAAAVAERLADPELAAREGAAGRRRAEERFDLRAASRAMAELYADVLAARR